MYILLLVLVLVLILVVVLVLALESEGRSFLVLVLVQKTYQVPSPGDPTCGCAEVFVLSLNESQNDPPKMALMQVLGRLGK